MKQFRNFTLLGFGVFITLLILSGCDIMGGSNSDPIDFSPVSTVLARGYDVFDVYADPEYVRSAILDFDALEAGGMLEKTALERTEFRTISGTTSSSYQKNLGVTASLSGDFKFFSGSMGSAYTSSTIGNTENQYATIQARVRKSLYTIKDRTTPAILKPYLTETFAYDINDTSGSSETSPESLFNTYGTHVMTAVILGARYDYNMAADKTDESSSTSISGYTEAKFSSITTEAGFDTINVDKDAFSTSETKVIAVGGNSALAAGTDEAYANWRNSITDDTVVFSDYGANGLIPIWEFCEDSARRAALESAYMSWSDTKYSQYVSEPSPIPSGTVKFTLVSFYNKNVGDGGGAEWLWKVQLYSDKDSVTRRLSSARTDKDDAKKVGEGDSVSFNNSYSYTVDLNGDDTFWVRPLLEECDGDDLGLSSTSNDRYCTANSGPRFNFAIENQKLVFKGTDTNTNSEGYFSLDSGGMSNDSLSLSKGSSKTVYLVLKQFNSESPDEWVQFKMTVSWK